MTTLRTCRNPKCRAQTENACGYCTPCNAAIKRRHYLKKKGGGPIHTYARAEGAVASVPPPPPPGFDLRDLQLGRPWR